MKRYIQAAVKNLTDESYETLLRIAHTSTDPRVLTQLAQDFRGGIPVLVASNPNTPQDVLDELSHSEHQTVRKAACANPSASSSAKAFALTEWKASGLVDFTLDGYFDYEISDETAYRKLLTSIRDFVAQTSGVQYLNSRFDSCEEEDDMGNEMFLKEIKFRLQFDMEPTAGLINTFREAFYDMMELDLPEFSIWNFSWDVLLER